jgi:Domain of unknown function (DUF4349)
VLVVMVGSLVVITAACGRSSKSSSSLAAPSRSGTASAASGAGSSAVAVPSPAATSGDRGGPATSTSGTLGATVSPAGPKIVTTANVTVQVKGGTLPQIFAAVGGLATGAGGYVSNSSTSFGGTDPNASLVLRVPASQFQAVMARMGALGTVTSETISGQDVTTEVADNGAQLATLQDEAQAARTLLARATSIGDILAIQDQVFALQSQIQQLSAQTAALSDEVSYATVSVQLTVPPVVAHRPPAEGTPARTWHLAVSNSAAVLRGIVLTLGWLAPLLILGLAIGIPAALWWRRRLRSSGPAAASPPA